MAIVSRIHLLEISGCHCAAEPERAKLRAIVGARKGNWFGVRVGHGGITSQLFHGLESTPGGSDVAVARFWICWLIDDCALAHLDDFSRAFGLDGKTVDVV